GGAVAVFAIVPAGRARGGRTGDAVAAPLARALLALLGLQLVLGIGAYFARFSPLWVPGEQATMLALPVVHRLVGGLLFAATVVLAVRLNGRQPQSGTAWTVRQTDTRPASASGGMGDPSRIRRES